MTCSPMQGQHPKAAALPPAPGPPKVTAVGWEGGTGPGKQNRCHEPLWGAQRGRAAPRAWNGPKQEEKKNNNNEKKKKTKKKRKEEEEGLTCIFSCLAQP